MPVFVDISNLEWLDVLVALLTPIIKLASGLVFIHQFVLATTYNDKNKVLRPTPFPDSFGHDIKWPLLDVLADMPDFDNENIQDGLKTTNPIKGWTYEDVLTLASRYRTSSSNYPNDHKEDPDRSPFMTWQRVNSDKPIWDTVTWSTKDKHLIWRAYVMWDHARMEHEFQNYLGESEPHPLAYTEEDLKEMHLSFQIRNEIYKRGGHGYWSRGDLSQIEWTCSPGFPPPDLLSNFEDAIREEYDRETAWLHTREYQMLMRGGLEFLSGHGLTHNEIEAINREYMQSHPEAVQADQRVEEDSAEQVPETDQAGQTSQV